MALYIGLRLCCLLYSPRDGALHRFAPVVLALFTKRWRFTSVCAFGTCSIHQKMAFNIGLIIDYQYYRQKMSL
jgi:hypothetical protein